MSGHVRLKNVKGHFQKSLKSDRETLHTGCLTFT
jgi:hypothetical protein